MIDAFAIVAILNGEADAQRLAAAIEAAKAPSPVGLRGDGRAGTGVDQSRDDHRGHGDHRRQGLRQIRQGPPSGEAQYAAARAYRAPLLFKGDDFSRTDVKTVKI